VLKQWLIFAWPSLRDWLASAASEMERLLTLILPTRVMVRRLLSGSIISRTPFALLGRPYCRSLFEEPPPGRRKGSTYERSGWELPRGHLSAAGTVPRRIDRDPTRKHMSYNVLVLPTWPTTGGLTNRLPENTRHPVLAPQEPRAM
jgi:hypothetical protein